MEIFFRHSFVTSAPRQRHVSILAKSLIISFQYNVESVYFFYSNPVLLILVSLSYFMLKLLGYGCVDEQDLLECVTYACSAAFCKLCQKVLESHIHLKIIIF
jgi:hypothetical protein